MPIMSGPDNWDAAMAPVPLGDPAKVELKKLRVAYYTTNGETDPTPEIQQLVKQCAGYFKDLGCKVTQDMPPKMKELAEARQKFSGANDARSHAPPAEEARHAAGVARSCALTGELLPSCGVHALVRSDGWHQERAARMVREVRPDRLSGEREAAAESARPNSCVRRARGGGSYTSQYNTTGWPAGVVRAGTSTEEPGLPLGIQLVGQPWRDDVVLAAMAHVEKQTGGWQMHAI